MNTFGRHFRVTTFGESHGKAYGVVVDGCPSLVSFSEDVIQDFLNRRRPGQFAWQSSRKEKDSFEVLSGVYNGKTLGTPIAVLVGNQDARPQDYEQVKQNPRAGHADDLWKEKYGHYDHRGGGRASGRETLCRVIGGAIASMFLKSTLKNLEVLAFATQIGDIQIPNEQIDINSLKGQSCEDTFFPNADLREKVKELLISAKKQGESYGGVVRVRIDGVPKGLGQPVFYKLKSDLTSALMSIGAIYAIEVGFENDVSLPGSLFHQEQSHYGGIRGGLSTGEPIDLKVMFKPTSSIGSVAQQGRHDPCIIPRAIPVIESMIYLVLADHLLAQRLDRV